MGETDGARAPAAQGPEDRPGIGVGGVGWFLALGLSLAVYLVVSVLLGGLLLLW